MARTHTAFSLAILSAVARASGVCSVQQLLTGQIPGGKNRKAVYDTIFRLTQQGFLEYANPARTQLALTSDGKLLLATRFPERDGVWKMVIFDIPEGIEVKVDKQTAITVAGANKGLVGQVAAKIRSFRPPEPYLGKGVRYAGEHIRKKAGKSAGK
jgi:hypothetical protein